VYVCTNLFDVVCIDLAGGVLGCDGEAGIIEPRVIDKRHPGRAVVISHDLRVVSKSRRCHPLCSHSLPSSEMLAVLYRSAAGILTNVHKRKPWDARAAPLPGPRSRGIARETHKPIPYLPVLCTSKNDEAHDHHIRIALPHKSPEDPD